MPFYIVKNDITKMETDAIVNAANSRLKMGGGVCGAIFAAAGPEKLQKACDEHGYCATGKAVITEGFQLPAKYVIHAVGPVWQGGCADEKQLLIGAYQNSLELARKYRCRSISFPLISSGIYGYPKDRALEVAVSVISEYVRKHDMDVYLVVFDQSAVALKKQMVSQLEQYICDYHKAEIHYNDRKMDVSPVLLREDDRTELDDSKNLQERLRGIGESFSEQLMRLIHEKRYQEVDVYKRANMDRKHFSKIKNNREYQPKKKTVLAFAVALQLTVSETEDLLDKAGFSLSNSSKTDVIVRYFLEKEEYNIFLINEVLFYYEQPLLGN